MTPIARAALAALVGLWTCASSDRRLGASEGFRDDFSAHAEGSSGAPRWKVVGGDWRVLGGRFVQSAEGSGLAVTADAGVPGDHRIEVRFRTTKGNPGGGVLFGLTDPGRVADCHVVRADPEGLYYGTLDGTGGFRGDGPVPALVERGRWNTIVVRVDVAEGVYSIDFNGVRMADGLSLERSGPRVGLLASHGAQEFSLCEVRPAGEPSTSSASGAAPDRPRPVDLAAARDGSLVLLSRRAPKVRVLRPDGSESSRFGRLLEGDRPIAIEVGPAGEVWVVDERSGRLDRYPAEGGPAGGLPSGLPANAAPRSIAATPPLREPRGLGVLPDGRLVVAESAARRVAILSPDGVRLGEVGAAGGGPGEHEQPFDVAVDSRGRVVVADYQGCRIQAFRPDGGGGFELDARSPWMAPPGRLAVGPGGRVAALGRFAYYETGGAVRLLEPDLLPRGFVGCFAAGDLSEEGGVCFAGDGGLVCLARKGPTLYRFPDDLAGAADPVPVVSRGADGTTRIAWSPLLPAGATVEPRLEWRRVGAPDWRAAPASIAGGRCEARIEGLDPAGVYEYRFLPALDSRTLAGTAPRGPWSKPYRLLGPEPRGKLRYLELSVIAGVYLSFEDAGSGTRFELARDRLGDKLRRELDVGREFYARNTRFRLHVAVDLEVIESPAAKVRDGWVDPEQARADLAPILDARGKKVEDYDSVIAMWAEPGWQAGAADDAGSVGGGGLTSFAYSTYGIGGRAAWLFVHEYHHQIDAFFNESGHLDYPLNHPDPTVQPGRYGQHWDCNAFYLRTWPEESWFLSRFGRVKLAADADEDGVPDADAALPLDEARLGSDPSKADTDADGLGDLDEALAGTFRGADPRRPDTDGDGVRDGADRLPLDPAFRAGAEVARGAPSIDGAWTEGEWQEVGRAAEAGVVVGARWDGDALYFAARAARPVRVALEVDARNDGWFLEDDNAFAELEVTGGGSPPVHGARGARSAGSGGESAPVAEAALPAPWAPALARRAGARFGLCIRVAWREGEGEAARDREVFLASPWELVEMTLADSAR